MINDEVYTDDSGVVISKSMYEEIYGKNLLCEFKSLDVVKPKPVRSTNDFAIIKKISEKPTVQRHRKKNKPSKNKKNRENPAVTVECSYCHEQIAVNNVVEHVINFHLKTTIKAKLATKEQVKTNNQAKHKNKNNKIQFDNTHYKNDFQDEHMDGSKGLGHMRRESDGKFGSFPLHDDYTDESNSD